MSSLPSPSDAPVSHWYGSLRDLPSRGEVTPKAGTMAGLHAARQKHWGQFWTPLPLAQALFGLAEPHIDAVLRQGRRAHILDNSVGSGRLFASATPQRAELWGIDVDARAIEALSEAATLQGFTTHFRAGSMTEIRPVGHDVALINPPFSLTLSAPGLPDWPCCVHGRLGPRSSTVSHLFALHQACEAAALVIAVLPVSAESYILDTPSLAKRCGALIRLPVNSFEESSATVETLVAIFGSAEKGRNPYRGSLDQARNALGAAFYGTLRIPSVEPSLRPAGEGVGPSITTPVTGKPAVRIYRHRRRIALSFLCGFVEARVRNALLHGPVAIEGREDRLPRGVRFEGDGKLLIDAALCGAFDTHLETLSHLVIANGGKPVIDRDLVGYLRRESRRQAVLSVPLRRFVEGDSTEAATLRPGPLRVCSKQKQVLNPKRWGSALVAAGEELTAVIEATPGGVVARLSKGSDSVAFTRDELLYRYTVSDAAAAPDWTLMHTGRAVASPQRARAVLTRLAALGALAWLWDYQRDDVLEMSMTNGGVVGGQLMGLGKSRIAAALLLLGGRHNLYVVEAGLLEELSGELRKLGVPDSEWQVIDDLTSVFRLRRINLISYNRLRMPLCSGARQTYAHRLRHRIHTLVADEVHCVGNSSTDQVRALYTVAARRRYGFSGTAISNYPRQLLPLAVWVMGDGTASQPYGQQRPFVSAALLQSSAGAMRGVDVFRQRFASFEWVTNAFLENMDAGSKREIPVLRNVDQFRAWCDRLVLRRVWEEPEVRRHVRIPRPERREETIGWDEAHLGLYLATCEEFAAWWREQRRLIVEEGRSLNLVSILARISAVETACNFPQDLKGPHARFAGLTSKQIVALRRIRQYVAGGHRSVVFARSPGLLQLIERHLSAEGVHCIAYNGQIDPTVRTRRLNEEFRAGNGGEVLLVSEGTGATGLNLPMASRVLFLNRQWTERRALQAEFRVLRPQQTQTVVIDRIDLEGSIDIYQAQMVAFKSNAAAMALDHRSSRLGDQAFLGWLTILDRFCESLAQMRGVSRFDLRDSLTS